MKLVHKMIIPCMGVRFINFKNQLYPGEVRTNFGIIQICVHHALQTITSYTESVC